MTKEREPIIVEVWEPSPSEDGISSGYHCLRRHEVVEGGIDLTFDGRTVTRLQVSDQVTIFVEAIE